MNDVKYDRYRPKRDQLFVSLGLLLVVVASCGAIAVAAHSRPLEVWLTSRDVARFCNGDEHMANRGNRLDFEDRWILDDLPNADRTRGGVYFFGTSPMKWAMADWAIPDETRPLVHNYAVGATGHSLQLQLIRYLVENEQLLEAGSDKVHVVLGLYWSMGQYWRPSGFFGPLWERHGLYRYDERSGIRRVSGFFECAWLSRERGRCSSFLGGNSHRLARTLALSLGMPLTETENIQDPARVRQWASSLAERNDWELQLGRQMGALEEIVQYLGERNVGVTVVLLPQRLPFEDLPMPVAYRQQVAEFCQTHTIEFVDLSRLLSEDEFWDMNHSNYAGLMKTHAALMDVARDRLRSMPVVP